MKRTILIISLLLACALSAFADIRVMSFNVRYQNDIDGINSWKFRKSAIPAMIYDIRPAVFGVQEAMTGQLEYILENCPCYKEVGVGRDDGADGGEHMSVFYNTDSLKLIKWGNYWLSETPDRPSKGWDAACRRTATWTLLEVKSTGEKFYFVNTHLDHKGVEARRLGLKLLYDRIKDMNPQGYPMVLTGDFNVLPDNAGLKELNTLMKPARFTAENADPNGSFNGFGLYAKSKSAPTLDNAPADQATPIDYIYYCGFSKCKTFKVVTRIYCEKTYISDHYPIYSDLVF